VAWGMISSGAWFQSLSGFQVRCNSFPWPPTSHFIVCFNPYRVFKFVATPLPRNHPEESRGVSIPIGFSSSLQLGGSGTDCTSPGYCFNPYRVFKFVAT